MNYKEVHVLYFNSDEGRGEGREGGGKLKEVGLFYSHLKERLSNVNEGKVYSLLNFRSSSMSSNVGVKSKEACQKNVAFSTMSDNLK